METSKQGCEILEAGVLNWLGERGKGPQTDKAVCKGHQDDVTMPEGPQDGHCE